MNRNYSYLRRLLLLLVLAVFTLFIGCGDDKSGSTTEPGTVERLFTYPVFQGCGTCHYPGTTEPFLDGGPDLTTAASFRNSLVDKNRNSASFTWELTSDDCTDTLNPYVSPKSTKNSMLLGVISEDYEHYGCGSLGVHIGTNANLSQAALEDLLLWIEKGALPPRNNP